MIRYLGGLIPSYFLSTLHILKFEILTLIELNKFCFRLKEIDCEVSLFIFFYPPPQSLNNVKIKIELIKLNLKLMKDIKLSEETVILALFSFVIYVANKVAFSK